MSIVYILLLVLLTCITACGNNTSGFPDQQVSGQKLDVQEKTNTESDTQVGTGQGDVVQGELPAADTKASVDGLIGSWTGIDSADRFVNITKTDTGYQYEDNEGKYPAEYKDGTLKIKISDSDTADVYIDAESGHMLSVYQDNLSEYKKKEP
jgi:hypothetical protein